jgi:AraC-like DNA-binding protein
VTFEKEVVLVERGTFLWIMPGVIHRTRHWPRGQGLTNYYFRFRMTDPASGKDVRLENDWIRQPDAWPVLPYFKHLVDSLRTPCRFQWPKVRSALVLMATWILERQNSEARSMRVFTADQRARLLRFADVNQREELTPARLAEMMELSPNYFTRLFHRSFNLTPKQWLIQHRIQKAATLLMETEMKSKEIAYQLGYSDRYVFSKQFKQVMGVGPREFRAGLQM